MKARIFLADHRVRTESSTFRSLHYFSFGHQRKTGSDSLLYIVNDDTLAPRHHMRYHVDEASVLVVVPLVGEVSYRDNRGMEGTVEPGRVCLVPASKGYEVELGNPHGQELNNYLCLGLREEGDSHSRQVDLHLRSQREGFTHVALTRKSKLSIGTFNGRSHFTLPVQPGAHVFVLAIEGAFEIQNRLLQPRDGLALSGIDQLEGEALSNHAIVLIVETEADPTRPTREAVI